MYYHSVLRYTFLTTCVCLKVTSDGLHSAANSTAETILYSNIFAVSTQSRFWPRANTERHLRPEVCNRQRWRLKPARCQPLPIARFWTGPRVEPTFHQHTIRSFFRCIEAQSLVCNSPTPFDSRQTNRKKLDRFGTKELGLCQDLSALQWV